MRMVPRRSMAGEIALVMTNRDDDKRLPDKIRNDLWADAFAACEDEEMLRGPHVIYRETSTPLYEVFDFLRQELRDGGL